MIAQVCLILHRSRHRPFRCIDRHVILTKISVAEVATGGIKYGCRTTGAVELVPLAVQISTSEIEFQTRRRTRGEFGFETPYSLITDISRQQDQGARRP